MYRNQESQNREMSRHIKQHRPDFQQPGRSTKVQASQCLHYLLQIRFMWEGGIAKPKYKEATGGKKSINQNGDMWSYPSQRFMIMPALYLLSEYPQNSRCPCINMSVPPSSNIPFAKGCVVLMLRLNYERVIGLSSFSVCV